MFEYLKDFPVILVTGPQRSGTRICAKMIAHDTGHRFVDEREIHTDSLYELFWQILHGRPDGESIVVQCPALCYVIHRIPNMIPDETAVVMVQRSLKDIHASQMRVNWEWEFVELLHYPLGHRAAHSKYYNWRWQKKNIEHHFDVYYDRLEGHPLWVPKEQRKDWDAWQTE